MTFNSKTTILGTISDDEECMEIATGDEAIADEESMARTNGRARARVSSERRTNGARSSGRTRGTRP